jgi:hypothetical protein
VQLAGKIMMIVEAFTQQPITVWYREEPKSNDKKWAEELLNKLPISGLLIVDWGFFSFVWFDQFTEEKKFFLTRMREKTSLTVKKVLSEGLYYRDEIIDLGQYRSNPCPACPTSTRGLPQPGEASFLILGIFPCLLIPSN